MKCSKCNNNLFYIKIIPCCDDCSENPAYDEDTSDYTTDLKTIDDKSLERSGVENDGECNFGTAYGPGCYMFVCKECNHATNLSVMDGC